MFLHLHRPGPPLDRFVELVTYYEGFNPDHTKEKLLPDGAVEIIVDLTDTPKRLFHPHDLSRFTAFHDPPPHPRVRFPRVRGTNAERSESWKESTCGRFWRRPWPTS